MSNVGLRKERNVPVVVVTAELEKSRCHFGRSSTTWPGADRVEAPWDIITFTGGQLAKILEQPARHPNVCVDEKG